MQQNHLRSAVYSSLIKPVAVGSDSSHESSQCRAATRPVQIAIDNWLSEGGDWLSGGGEGAAMARRDYSELHFSHVSKGAMKLTQMIESLSNGPNLDGQSKYIAEDLLQGAMDLQDSLGVLRRIQEASAMAGRRRSQRYEGESDTDVLGFEDVGSRRFAVSGRRERLQEPRLSLDGSSRNSSELRKAVGRHNLGSVSFDDQNMSSSRFLSFGGSYEQKAANNAEQPKKSKSSSLIAKLMGLEDAAPKTGPKAAQTIAREEEKKCFNPSRPGLDILIPKSTKLPSIEQLHEQRQKSLQEIIETMQFKGLLKSAERDDRSRSGSRYHDIPQPERFERSSSKDGKAPPIVIMRPVHSPYRERGEVQKDLLSGKSSVKEKPPPFKFVQEKKVADDELVLPKPLRRTEAKKVEKTRVEPFRKDNVAPSDSHKLNKKDGIGTGKKTSITEKPPVHRRKQEVKAANAPISQVKSASARQTKLDERQSLERTDVSRQRSKSPVRNVRSPVLTPPQSSVSSTKEKKTSGAKPLRKSAPAKGNVINNTKKLKDGKASDPLCAAHYVPTTIPLPDNDLAQNFCNRDDITEDYKIFHEVVPEIEIDKILDIKVVDQIIREVVQLPELKITTRKRDGIEEDIKWLLTSSQSFLGLAQEVFGIDVHQPILYQRKGFEEVVTRNAKLFDDCGKELLACRSRQGVLLSHPMMQAHGHVQTLCTSLDQLVEEISDGIGKLISYIVVGDDATPEDSLYIRLKRDLQSTELSVNTSWDVGWRSSVCIEESDQVVGELQEYILSFLVEEMIMDFN